MKATFFLAIPGILSKIFAVRMIGAREKNDNQKHKNSPSILSLYQPSSF